MKVRERVIVVSGEVEQLLRVWQRSERLWISANDSCLGVPLQYMVTSLLHPRATP